MAFKNPIINILITLIDLWSISHTVSFWFRFCCAMCSWVQWMFFFGFFCHLKIFNIEILGNWKYLDQDFHFYFPMKAKIIDPMMMMMMIFKIDINKLIEQKINRSINQSMMIDCKNSDVRSSIIRKLIDLIDWSIRLIYR